MYKRQVFVLTEGILSVIFTYKGQVDRMFKFNDIFLVIVGGYVIYKIGYVDGFTLVNLFILVCLTVAVVSTALRRSGYADRLEKLEAVSYTHLDVYKRQVTAYTENDIAVFKESVTVIPESLCLQRAAGRIIFRIEI